MLRPRRVVPFRPPRRLCHRTLSILPDPPPSSSSSPPPFSSSVPPPKSSVSPDELAHFQRLSASWWDASGPFALLHRMNPSRTQFLKSRVVHDVSPSLGASFEEIKGPEFLKGKRVLDVGCGGGIFSEVLARLGGQVVAIDAVEENVRVAALHAFQDPWLRRTLDLSALPELAAGLNAGTGSTEGRLQYRAATAEALVKEGERFDVVCAMEVLEHVESPRDFLFSLAELTKPGGHIVLSTISRTSLAKFLTITLAESSLPIPSFLASSPSPSPTSAPSDPGPAPSRLGPIVPPGTHHYEKFIKPSELLSFFRDDLLWSSASASSSQDPSQRGSSEEGGEQVVERSVLETRGVVYEPWRGQWRMTPRGAKWGELCNYYFGAKKPL